MKIIGMNEFKFYDGYTEQNETRHEIYVTEDRKNYIISLNTLNSDCPSGYTSASEGEIEINETKKFPPIEYRFIKKDNEYPSVKTPYLYNVEDIFGITENGDEYYPAGFHYVNKDYFKRSSRQNSGKRKVWIFKGGSTLGKTFLSDKIDLEKYETDMSDTLPDLLWQDIIVIGNKYKFSKKEIIAKIPDINDTEVIYVKFSKD